MDPEAAAPVRRHAHVMNSRRQRSAQKVTVAQAPASLLRQHAASALHERPKRRLAHLRDAVQTTRIS